jgi:acyl carrier protein
VSGKTKSSPAPISRTTLAPNEIDKVVLIESFKEEFGVEIPDDAAKTILTVGDAIKFLEKASAA